MTRYHPLQSNGPQWAPRFFCRVFQPVQASQLANTPRISAIKHTTSSTLHPSKQAEQQYPFMVLSTNPIPLPFSPEVLAFSMVSVGLGCPRIVAAPERPIKDFQILPFHSMVSWNARVRSSFCENPPGTLVSYMYITASSLQNV